VGYLAPLTAIQHQRLLSDYDSSYEAPASALKQNVEYLRHLAQPVDLDSLSISKDRLLPLTE
jgi:hypothetical protein